MNVGKPDVKYVRIETLSEAIEIFLNLFMSPSSTSLCRSFNDLYQTTMYILQN